MKFSLNQQDLQKSLNYCQGVIEKRSTLPILSNILIEASNSKLRIIATDLDLIFINEIKDVKMFTRQESSRPVRRFVAAGLCRWSAVQVHCHHATGGPVALRAAEKRKRPSRHWADFYAALPSGLLGSDGGLPAGGAQLGRGGPGLCGDGPLRPDRDRDDLLQPSRPRTPQACRRHGSADARLSPGDTRCRKS